MVLVYTLPELAKEYKTAKETVYLLEELGELRSISFSSTKVISIFEAERFLKENAGRDFDQIIKEAKKRKKLEKLNNNVVAMREAQA